MSGKARRRAAMARDRAIVQTSAPDDWDRPPVAPEAVQAERTIVPEREWTEAECRRSAILRTPGWTR